MYGAIIMDVAYERKVDNKDDYCVALAERVLDSIEKVGTFGYHLVEFVSPSFSLS
jgi:hypothetical protein